ncbi:MAG: cyclodeaminase/cyclohydrolase family protein [Spirochaetia bacterium]|jgi:methenyltetrahydrofolate cyclohydrolase
MKLLDLTVRSLLDELASESPAPGGGSVAALAGACAAALCEMVCRLTLGNARLSDTWPLMGGILSDASRLRARLQALIDEDAEAYSAVVAARRLPKDTPAEEAARKLQVQAGIVRSAQVPLETLEAIAALADLVERAAQKGNPSCITDAGSAAQMIRAGAVAAAWNVRVNLPSVRDVKLKEELGSDTARILERIIKTVERVDAMVEQRLNERSRT